MTAILLLLMPPAGLAAGCLEDAAARPPPLALQTVVAGLRAPVHLTHAGDGSARLYVVEQDGVIRVIADGRLLPDPLLDIRTRVASGGEKGLLSVAFHPRYRSNGLFYVDYTSAAGGLHTGVARYARAAPEGADPASERILLEVAQPFANHNGGQIAFGPDGYLYIGMGDGGLAYDPFGHGQDTATLLGALLRIDVDRTEPPLAYAVPADNPYAGRSGRRAEIWAYGLRNPWRFSFDRATGRLYLADVGQDRIEEIDVIVRGGNYGWAILEGNRCVGLRPGGCAAAGLIAPIHTYDHTVGASITGGHVYRGAVLPGLCGYYLYGDYVSGAIWGLRYDGTRVLDQRLLLQTDENISSFGEDEAGEAYVVGHRSGRIMKIVAAGR